MSHTLIPLEKTLQVTHVITAFDEMRPLGYFFPGEMHDFWEMVYVKEGCVVVTAEERVLSLFKGQLLFHKPMEFHSLRTTYDSTARVMIISFVAHGETMEKLAGRELLLDFSEEEEYVNILFALRRYLQKKHTPDGAIARAALEKFLLCMAEKPIYAAQKAPSPSNRLYEYAMGVLNEHCSEALTLPQIARLCQTSESSLKKAFGVCSHTGVMHCFTSIKIRQAARLLMEGQSIVQVSDSLSFSSPSYFHTVFRREMHCTPSEYVQMMKKQNRS